MTGSQKKGQPIQSKTIHTIDEKHSELIDHFNKTETETIPQLEREKEEIKKLDNAIKQKDKEVKQTEKKVKELESKKRVNKKQVEKLKKEVKSTKAEIKKAQKAVEIDDVDEAVNFLKKFSK